MAAVPHATAAAYSESQPPRSLHSPPAEEAESSSCSSGEEEPEEGVRMDRGCCRAWSSDSARLLLRERGGDQALSRLNTSLWVWEHFQTLATASSHRPATSSSHRPPPAAAGDAEVRSLISRMESTGVPERRALNFTDDELNLMIDLVGGKKKTIMGTKRARAPRKLQTKAWREISVEMAANSAGQVRTFQQCRKRFSDLVRSAKGKRSHNAAQRSKTGGGSAILHQLTPLQERVSDLLHFAAHGRPMRGMELGSPTCASVDQPSPPATQQRKRPAPVVEEEEEEGPLPSDNSDSESSAIFTEPEPIRSPPTANDPLEGTSGAHGHASPAPTPQTPLNRPPTHRGRSFEAVSAPAVEQIGLAAKALMGIITRMEGERQGLTSSTADNAAFHQGIGAQLRALNANSIKLQSSIASIDITSGVESLLQSLVGHVKRDANALEAQLQERTRGQTSGPEGDAPSGSSAGRTLGLGTRGGLKRQRK